MKSRDFILGELEMEIFVSLYYSFISIYNLNKYMKESFELKKRLI